MALAKCREAARSGLAARAEENAGAAEVRRASTFAGFVARRVDVLAAGLGPIREEAFAAGAFKCSDLAVPEARLKAFFAGLDFDFVFIAMSPRNLYG